VLLKARLLGYPVFPCVYVLIISAQGHLRTLETGKKGLSGTGFMQELISFRILPLVVEPSADIWYKTFVFLSSNVS
jgi:hypothetical protein